MEVRESEGDDQEGTCACWGACQHGKGWAEMERENRSCQSSFSWQTRPCPHRITEEGRGMHHVDGCWRARTWRLSSHARRWGSCLLCTGASTPCPSHARQASTRDMFGLQPQTVGVRMSLNCHILDLKHGTPPNYKLFGQFSNSKNRPSYPAPLLPIPHHSRPSISIQGPNSCPFLELRRTDLAYT